MFDKKILAITFVFAFIVFISQGVYSDEYSPCKLEATLVNQDPYPAMPGEYVELVFQLSGVENPECNGAVFTVVEKYPFSLNKNDSERVLPARTYVKDYNEAWMLPYDVRVDEDAMEGKNELEVKFKSGVSNTGLYISEKFNVSIEDLRVDFETFIKDYEDSTDTLTIQILNTGEHDIEALKIKIPEQENIEIYETPENIVGSLDSNEETTADFKADPKDGEIRLIITYTDEINERRSIEKTVNFNSKYFQNGKDQGFSISFYLLIGLIALIAIIWFFRHHKKQKKR